GHIADGADPLAMATTINVYPSSSALIGVTPVAGGAVSVIPEPINIGIYNPAGPPGPPGTGLVIKGTVPTAADLPTTGNVYGDLWIAQDTGHGWLWELPGKW